MTTEPKVSNVGTPKRGPFGWSQELILFHLAFPEYLCSAPIIGIGQDLCIHKMNPISLRPLPWGITGICTSLLGDSECSCRVCNSSIWLFTQQPKWSSDTAEGEGVRRRNSFSAHSFTARSSLLLPHKCNRKEDHTQYIFLQRCSSFLSQNTSRMPSSK